MARAGGGVIPPSAGGGVDVPYTTTTATNHNYHRTEISTGQRFFGARFKGNPKWENTFKKFVPWNRPPNPPPPQPPLKGGCLKQTKKKFGFIRSVEKKKHKRSVELKRKKTLKVPASDGDATVALLVGRISWWARTSFTKTSSTSSPPFFHLNAPPPP